LRNANQLAAQLDKSYAGAAASLREGLEEMFTVARLGSDSRLAKTLTTSNLVESMISIAGHQPQRHPLARWADGAALTRRGHAQRRAILLSHQGLQEMPKLVAALHRHAHPETVTDTQPVGDTAGSSLWIVTHMLARGGHEPIALRTSRVRVWSPSLGPDRCGSPPGFSVG
jgi:putative transposase